MILYRTRQPFLQYLSVAIISIFVLLPFSAFLTTWIGSNTGGYRLVQLWAEIIICLVALALVVLTGPSKLKKILGQEKALMWLVVIYVIITLVLGAVALAAHRVNATALIYSLIINLRFLLLFAVTFVLYAQLRAKPHWAKLLLIPAVIVLGFGLLQLALPANFLAHFGYSPRTILPFNYVNSNSQYFRLQSFLRGPNPLGAYLILIISTTAALYSWSKRYRVWLLILTLLAFTVLFFSYSRSALIGACISVLIILAYRIKVFQKGHGKQLALGFIGLFLVVGVFGLTHSSSHTVQELLLHTDNGSQVKQSSNSVRLKAIKAGLHDIAHQPLGQGPGTAGPASVHNNNMPRIAENYYIQIGQEVGIIGLIVFVAINILVAYRLWLRKSQPLALILLASFAGITFVNMLSHAWTDNTLALLWWGLAGLAITPVGLSGQQGDIINKKRKHYKYEEAKKPSTA